MKSDEKDLLDIVFEHRNKAYGAYFLRRNYPVAMRDALFLTICGLALLFVGPYLLAAMNKPLASIERPIIFDPGTPPPVEKPVEPPPPVERPLPPPPAAPSVKFVPPTPTPDDLVKKEADLLDLDRPIDAQPAAKTVAGDPNSTALPIDDPIDDGELNKVAVVKAAPPEEPVLFVEAMPQFPGGDAAMMKFLSENLRYPPVAKEEGIQGRVFITFVVELDGQLSDVKIAKGALGGGIEAEAVRVVRSMPPWRAGNQNGRPVRVRMNLPIVFRLE